MTDRVKNLVVCIVMTGFLLTMTVVCIFKPQNQVSISERRELAKFPAINQESFLNGDFMEDFESYAKDQFPFREDLRALKAVVSTKIFGKHDNNGIYVANGFASALEYPLDEASIDNAAEKFNNIYERYISDKNMKVYLSIIPDKNYFMADSHGYPSMDYERLVNLLIQQLSFMEYIDIMDELSLTDYYRTDTHWKQENLTDIADKLKISMGAESDNSYKKKTFDKPFYGVYSGQSALNLKADTIKYLTNEVIEGMEVYDYQNDKEIPVYDMEKAYSVDPYEMFLSGSLSLITIENNMADTNKELIIFRDSFASAIAPLLAESYSKVTLVDIRYMRSDMLNRFINFENQDVLFLYSTTVLNNSETFK